VSSAAPIRLSSPGIDNCVAKQVVCYAHGEQEEPSRILALKEPPKPGRSASSTA
jgi:hypothetical protein